MKNPVEVPATTGLEIAIIGMAGRFPGARDVETFWQNLRQGISGIRFFSDEELLRSNPDLDRELLANPMYVKACGVLDGVEDFDAAFFGYNPREAEGMDPQQRLFLECAWEAMENAGYDPARYRGLIGVYGGVSMSTYVLNILSQPELLRSLGGLQLTIGNDKDYLATRVSYKLNLEGPSVNVQSACSSSLLAVHLACQGLLSGEADMVLAGGVSVGFPQVNGYLYSEAGILSPDGFCRAFDAEGKGTVGGNGVGIVVLKRLADALNDSDDIRAVIKGSAINNDGAMKVGFTAPRVEGQRDAIRAAQQLAEVDPETITYIESHGTATELGDPIEIAALTEAFRRGTDKKGFCAVGAVKTNIGHLDAAAGITGLIKTTRVVEKGEIPPNLHYESPNPELDLDNSPFYIPTELRLWDTGGTPRRAGVSSFGLGGTNVHVVLEQAPPVGEPAPSRRHQLLLLSARSVEALDTMTANLGECLAAGDLHLPDVAYTTQVGRKAMSHRRILVCSEGGEAARILRKKDARHLLSAAHEDTGERAPAFMFSGLGDQYVGMAWGLYRDEPAFRDELDRCAELFESHLGLDLRQVIFPSEVRTDAPDEDAPAAARLDLRKMVRAQAAGAADGEDDETTRRLNETRFTQPVLFALELALARLWMSWGVRPQAMVGYSLGEYVAATVAGVMTLEDATRLVAERAKLIHGLEAGAMLAVPLPEVEMADYLGEELDLSAVNGPSFCVAAGDTKAIEALAERLESEGVACRRLQTSHAFHSRRMQPIVEPLRRLLATIELQAPRIPYLSNVTGGWIRAAEATDPEYWLKHLCQPVRFGDALTELWRDPERILLEVGPGQSLTSLALQLPAAEGGSRVALPSLRSQYEGGEDQARLLGTLGQLWLAGLEISWVDFYDEEKRRRVALPTYPFERQRYWVERAQGGLGATAAAPAERSREKLPDLADWLYVPSWRRLTTTVGDGELTAGPWWVLHDGHALAETLTARLAEAGHEVHEVMPALPGAGAATKGDGRWTIDPESGEHYDHLLEELGSPAGVFHLWTLTAAGQERDSDGFADAMQTRGNYSLIALSQALDRRGLETPVPIRVLTNGLFEVENGDSILPEKSTLLGPVRVIPQELSAVDCRLIELGAGDETFHEELWREVRRPAAEPVVACRGRHRWVPVNEPLPLHADDCGADRLRPGGVYLITGGLGGIGLGMAEYLAREWQARLVLLGRSALPERSEWDQHRPAGDDLSRKIRQVEALEAAGSEVLVVAADVSDEAQMRRAVDLARERFGVIHGVIHAAGVPGTGIVQLKTRDMAAAVLAPKVDGTLVLEEVLRPADEPLGCEPLDFIVLFSSLSSVFGGIGQVDYCAANAFLGAFAQWSANLPGGGTATPVVAIDWCEWQWDAWSGEGLAMFNDEVRAQMRSQRQLSGLSFEEGAEVMRRTLASGLPQVLVSTLPLQERIDHENTISEVLAQLQEPSSRHPRPDLTTEFVAPRDDAETTIAGIWQDLLGVDRIGVHDDFFQLGGHSLIGTQVVSRLKDKFAVSVPLSTLFEAPTIADLAAVVTETAPDSAASSLPAITRVERDDRPEEDVDDMSDDEVEAMLAELLAEEQGQA